MYERWLLSLEEAEGKRRADIQWEIKGSVLLFGRRRAGAGSSYRNVSSPYPCVETDTPLLTDEWAFWCKPPQSLLSAKGLRGG